MRWCGGCAKAHVGAINKRAKKCEECGKKTPSFGNPEPEDKACLGLGRIVALYYRSSTLYQIH